MVVNAPFWKGRRVFLTGHTGFKGGWTSLLLGLLGAEVHGFAWPPQSEKGVFVAADVEHDVHSGSGDVRDFEQVRRAMLRAAPEIVIHMAAQSLVRQSYREPVETYATNLMGTVHVLEATRGLDVRAIIIVTTDKCYQNAGWDWGYREIDRLGGEDPYSNSKACAELAIDAYRRCFFSAAGAPAVGSVRAGNVIGGGDFAPERLVPDAMRAFAVGEVLRIRNPASVRPWQHVLDPVAAYLRLAERLVESGRDFAGAWNFGPDATSEVTVSTVAERLATLWGNGVRWEAEEGEHPYEAPRLTLDSSKARHRLAWRPMVDLDTSLRMTVAWHQALRDGADMRRTTLRQVEDLLAARTN
jgi:CDP-glucose 4,6-dehydratase